MNSAILDNCKPVSLSLESQLQRTLEKVDYLNHFSPVSAMGHVIEMALVTLVNDLLKPGVLTQP